MGTDVNTSGIRGARTTIGAVVALLMLALAPSAMAAFSMSGLQAAPASNQAGAHSDFTLHVAFPDAGTDVKKLVIHLPPGMVGDPTATTKCTVAQLNGDNCPASSQVGTVTTNATAVVLGPIGVPLSVPGTLYNLTPQTGEPARFGIVLRPAGGLLGKIVLQSAVKLRQTDYGLDTIIDNIPNSSNGLATHIDSMDVHLQGLAGSPQKPFMRNPTSCTPATTTFDATDYASTTATGTASFTPTGCAALDFSPTFLSSIGSPGHDSPPSKPPLTTVVEQDNGEAGVRNVDVVLPQGVGADTVALANHCPIANFTAGTCPANTIVGSAKATSPLLTQALSGPVSIVEPTSPGLPRLGLDLQGPLHIQLFGTFTLTPNGPGNSFTDIPDIPLSHFELNFDADKLVANSRDLCAAPKPLFPTSFLGWNGATQTGDVPVTVNGCGSGGGGGGGKVKAKMRVKNAASDKPALKLVVKEPKSKRAGAAKIKKTKLTLPKKLHFATGAEHAGRLAVKGGHHVQGFVSPNKLKVTTGPASKLVEKASGGLVLRRGAIAGHKLRFKLKVTDTAGKTTKLKLTTTAKP